MIELYFRKVEKFSTRSIRLTNIINRMERTFGILGRSQQKYFQGLELHNGKNVCKDICKIVFYYIWKLCANVLCILPVADRYIRTRQE